MPRWKQRISFISIRLTHPPGHMGDPAEQEFTVR